MVRNLILIGIGGGMGSIFRYLSGLFVDRFFPIVFPLATFMVNVLGCFLIGLLMGLLEKQHGTNGDLKFLFVIGFCGGYTTFSTFAFENISLMQNHQIFIAFMYIAFSVTAGLMATWAGLYVAS